MTPDRHAFRHHPLDGAALYFQPASGVHVRVATAATRGLRRAAPRVAMFGITNACNLACDFCSRDATRPSQWTVATAAAALRGLAAAGTLEVAYGGGEPFVFRGFAELVAELAATTALAQHVTTNGTRIDRASWGPFAGRFGVVRLSIYDGVDWRAPAAVLADAGQRWGANVLCDAARLAALPALLVELAARGARDVSLLSYVGGDPARQLDAAGERRLAAIVEASPLPCRVSVCLGDRLGVARLDGRDAAGDCGAGRDFISVTPDRRVQSCSFQAASAPGATAAELLDAWRTAVAAMNAPAPRIGCARALPQVPPPAPPRLAVWQSFSGNNSGECLMVARFHDPAAAAAYLAELLPGWTPDGAYPAPWLRLFADEGVLGSADVARDYPEASPRELVAIGATVMAAQYAADDAFPELRALAWKRGAEVDPDGVHVHDDATVLAAARAASRADRDALVAAASVVLPGGRAWPHGDHALARVPLFGRDHRFVGLPTLRDALAAWAGARRLAIEVVFDTVDNAALIAAKQRLGEPRPTHPRLTFGYWGPDADAAAARLAATLGERATRCGALVLIDPAPDRKRLAVVGYRAGAFARALTAARVRVHARLWFDPPARGQPKRTWQPAELITLDAWAAATFTRPDVATVRRPDRAHHRQHPTIEVETTEPARAMRALADQAAAMELRCDLSLAELDPLGAALHRLLG
ncbi:MAG: radical SAM protein [Myxococcales bacterium]|nr:radical SAM protein [Myxococcales bacterium]MBK7192608.1 radical SAM protein [Myxococcales bacterium]